MNRWASNRPWNDGAAAASMTSASAASDARAAVPVIRFRRDDHRRVSGREPRRSVDQVARSGSVSCRIIPGFSRRGAPPAHPRPASPAPSRLEVASASLTSRPGVSRVVGVMASDRGEDVVRD